MYVSILIQFSYDSRYEWKKNERELNMNDVNTYDIERGGAMVTIKHAGFLDQGFYQCSVTSIYGYGKVMSNTSHLTQATIGDPGSKDVLSRTVLEGQPFFIQANAQKSFPKPTYSWEM